MSWRGGRSKILDCISLKKALSKIFLTFFLYFFTKRNSILARLYPPQSRPYIDPRQNILPVKSWLPLYDSICCLRTLWIVSIIAEAGSFRWLLSFTWLHHPDDYFPSVVTLRCGCTTFILPSLHMATTLLYSAVVSVCMSATRRPRRQQPNPAQRAAKHMMGHGDVHVESVIPTVVATIIHPPYHPLHSLDVATHLTRHEQEPRTSVSGAMGITATSSSTSSSLPTRPSMSTV